MFRATTERVAPNRQACSNPQRPKKGEGGFKPRLLLADDYKNHNPSNSGH